ncbi:MAG: AMP-binding protein [Phycisphaerae bacterium]|nr:AMP-binding protein [Phycisphaerae bacterium]
MAIERELIWPQPAWAHRPMLITAREQLSHAQVRERVELASGVIAPGSRMLIRAVPTIGCVVDILACWGKGALAVVVDGRERESTIASIAREIGAGEVSVDGSSSCCAFDLDSLALALRTSGSTAAPKLAVHRLGGLIANAHAANARTPFSEDDCWLMSLSPHHIGGIGIIARALVSGGAIRLGRGPGACVADLADDVMITHVSMVATQLRRALDETGINPRMRSLEAIMVGGGPTPAAWRREAVGRGWPISATYGLTECASQVATGRASLDDAATHAGKPLDGLDVRLAEDGEIIVRGATVFAGYWTPRGVERQAASSFSTGDLGHFDERGALHVVGRKDAMFISGGENIHPEEIENVLCEVPGVSSACVIGIDDDRWQKRPIAFIAGAFDAAVLEGTLAAKLPRFKWPDHVYEMSQDEASNAKPSRAQLAKAARGDPLWTRRGDISSAERET